jgi:hypothetical protein
VAIQKFFRQTLLRCDGRTRRGICCKNIGVISRSGTAASWGIMDTLSLFGLFAVTAMLVAYALEDRSHWYVLAFAGACALGSVYGFLQGAWPFGLVEAVWAGVALRRWILRRR